MSDIHINGFTGIITVVVLAVVTFIFGFAIIFGYEFMKYYPWESIVGLSVFLYVLFKNEIPEHINKICWPLFICVKWFVGIISFLLLGALIIKVVGI